MKFVYSGKATQFEEIFHFVLTLLTPAWPFGICLLNSTANPAKFHPNWAGLAVLFSRQILNGSYYLSSLYFLGLNHSLEGKIVETHAFAFL